MAAKKSMKGKRYSDSEKQKIIAFVHEVNAEKGRGEASAASKKFGVSPITLTTWLSRATPQKGQARSQGARIKTLDQLCALDREIAATRKELNALEAQFKKLKARL